MKVLIAHDGSTYAEAAVGDLDRAGLPLDTKARVLSVVERQIQAFMTDGVSEEVCTRMQRRFPQWNVQMETATGRPAEMILKRAREWSADLIVVGTHGRSGLARLLLGSVSTVVTRDAPCSVRIVRAAKPRRSGPIRLLIGADGSQESDAAVREVCRRAWPAGAAARILTVAEMLVSTRADRLAAVADSLRKIEAEEYRWLESVADDSSFAHAAVAAG